jgi:hypothetical protein
LICQISDSIAPKRFVAGFDRTFTMLYDSAYRWFVSVPPAEKAAPNKRHKIISVSLIPEVRARDP